MDRLYIVVRADLAPGLQLSQALHAGQEWVLQRTDAARAWRASSNTVAIVAVPDVAEFARVIERAHRAGVDVVEFRDSDLSPELTALALEPGDGARRLCRGLPLALAPARGQGAPCTCAREAEGARL